MKRKASSGCLHVYKVLYLPSLICLQWIGTDNVYFDCTGSFVCLCDLIVKTNGPVFTPGPYDTEFCFLLIHHSDSLAGSHNGGLF